MEIIIFIGLGIISTYIANQLHIVTTRYKVKCNGKRWIVRDRKGKFVAMPKVSFNGFFDLLSIADK